MFVLDALSPREDSDFDVHVSPRIALEEERELVFVAPVEKLLRCVAVDVGCRTEAAYHIDKVHAHYFVARRAVYDGEDGIVLSCIASPSSSVGSSVTGLLEEVHVI